jgi:anti-anti-sigma factor
VTPGHLLPFELHYEPGRDGLVVTMVGELDLAAAGRVLALADLPEARTGQVVLDLTSLSFIDSFGVKAISALNEACRDLRYRGAQGVVARVLRIAKLDDKLEADPPT